MTVFVVWAEYCFSQNGEVAWLVGVHKTKAGADEEAEVERQSHRDEHRVVFGDENICRCGHHEDKHFEEGEEHGEDGCTECEGCAGYEEVDGDDWDVDVHVDEVELEE